VRDGGDHCWGVRVEALGRVARAQDNEAAVLKASRDSRLDEARRAHRLGELGDEGAFLLGACAPDLVNGQDEASGRGQAGGDLECGAAMERQDAGGIWNRLLGWLLCQEELYGLGEDFRAGRAARQVSL
jgi:hypothetical protein